MAQLALSAERTTLFSPCRTYRYTLWRAWDMWNDRYLMVCGLNPSTADETSDDPTIRHCVDYAKRWGYSALCMTNLFAYRATDPSHLVRVADPVGPENNRCLVRLARDASSILAAWGTQGRYQYRCETVMALFACRTVLCLGMTKHGFPRHPLYVAKTQQPLPYSGLNP